MLRTRSYLTSNFSKLIVVIIISTRGELILTPLSCLLLHAPATATAIVIFNTPHVARYFVYIALKPIRAGACFVNHECVVKFIEFSHPVEWREMKMTIFAFTHYRVFQPFAWKQYLRTDFHGWLNHRNHFKCVVCVLQRAPRDTITAPTVDAGSWNALILCVSVFASPFKFYV